MVGIIVQGRLTDEQAYQYLYERVDVHGEQPERRPLEQTWFANQAYFAGQQWFVEADGRIRAPKRLNPHREYYVANRILPKTMRAISKLLQLRVSFGVVPNTDSWEDIQATEIAEKFRRHILRVASFDSKIRRALQWAAVCGSGYLKCTWDPMAGTPNRVYLRDNKSRQPDITPLYDDVVRQEKERMGLFDDSFPGEVRIDVPSPYQIFWDPVATGGGIADCEWITQMHITPLTKLHDEWGSKVDGLAVDESWRGAELYEEQIRFMTTGLRGVEFGNQPWALRGNRVRMTEFFERPKRNNNWKGRYILIAGDRVLRNDDNPYAATGHPLPFVKIDWFPFEGRFVGLSLVEQIRGPQRAYNRGRSHHMEYMKTQGYAPTYFPKGSHVKPMQIISGPGRNYEYNKAAGPPIFANAPQLPPYTIQITDMARGEMDEISAQTDPTNNKLPGQLRSGSAIHAMQEDNNAILTPTADSLHEAVATVGSMGLSLASLYYDKPRQIRVVGEDMSYEVEEFKGADLRGHTAVNVVNDENRFRSVNQYRAEMMDLVQAGGINPNDPVTGQEDRMLILEAMDVKSAAPLLKSKRQQEKGEQRNIRRMIREPEFIPETREWEDAQQRMHMLERFLNSTEFERIDGLAKTKIVNRWKILKSIHAQEIAAQMEMMKAQQGTPGTPGKPSAPKGT